MTAYTKNMNQSATYWPPAAPNGYGETDFAGAEVISCRWQDDAVLFRDAQGREMTSSAVVYTESQLENGGYLILGDYYDSGNDPHSVGAKEIRQVYTTQNLKNTVTLNKVFL